MGADGASARRLWIEHGSLVSRAAGQPRLLERTSATLRRSTREGGGAFWRTCLAAARSARLARGAGRKRKLVRPAVHSLGRKPDSTGTSDSRTGERAFVGSQAA